MTHRHASRTFLATPLLLALLAEANAFETPVVERYSAPPAGFTWTESRHNTGIFGNGVETVRFTVGERQWKDRSLIAFESNQGTILADANGGWIAQLAPDGSVRSTWEPPLTLPHPLHVSKTWTRTHQVTDAKGDTRALQVSCRIDNYGEVTVPAGSFRAFEIHCLDSRNLSSVIWHDPSQGIWIKSSMHAGKPGEARGTREQQLTSISEPR